MLFLRPGHAHAPSVKKKNVFGFDTNIFGLTKPKQNTSSVRLAFPKRKPGQTETHCTDNHIYVFSSALVLSIHSKQQPSPMSKKKLKTEKSGATRFGNRLCNKQQIGWRKTMSRSWIGNKRKNSEIPDSFFLTEPSCLKNN